MFREYKKEAWRKVELMRKKSHWRLADYLMRENERPIIEFMFKIGSVAPDFMLRSMIKGHSYETTTERVISRLEKLEEYGCWNLVSAYRLGYVTHYLADYFTAPHNMQETFGFKEHCVFEKHQLQMLREQLEEQWETPACYKVQSDVMAYLCRIHEEYMSQSPEVERDCDYIVTVTEQVAYQMFALFNERQQSASFQILHRKASA